LGRLADRSAFTGRLATPSSLRAPMPRLESVRVAQERWQGPKKLTATTTPDKYRNRTSLARRCPKTVLFEAARATLSGNRNHCDSDCPREWGFWAGRVSGQPQDELLIFTRIFSVTTGEKVRHPASVNRGFPSA